MHFFNRTFQYLLSFGWVFFLSVGPSVGLYAQNSGAPANNFSSLYYYNGSQKIYLSTSSTNIYVETRASSEVAALQKTMNAAIPAAAVKMQALAKGSRGLVKVSNPAAFDSTLALLMRQPGVVVARPAVHTQQGNDHLYEESFYVKLKAGTSFSMLQNEVAKMGCALINAYKYDQKVFLIHAGLNAQFDGLQMANLFYETGLFEYAEPDFRPLTLLHRAPPPNDYLFPLQWGLKNTGISEQFNGTPGADIGIEDAWLITKGSPSIKIAVIDEGVDRTHPDLINNIDPLGFGLVAPVIATGGVLSADRSHGTSCAGIIAAESDNGIGIAGVAPLCKIVPVNITINAQGTFGSSLQLATGIDWAWNEGGADILSNSWGGGLASSLIHEAIKRATTLGRGGKGAIVLFSSGNDNSGVASPAIFPEVISVGAMDMCYQRKAINTCDAENFWGSNYGASLDVSAPGVKIATTKTGGFYNLEFNGTSSACPFAAGVAALILGVNSEFSQVQVREILERSTQKVGNYSYSRVVGQPNGSWSRELGYGMVNAHQAVLGAQNFDFACKVSISANGPTQLCSGGSVTLQVNNPAGSALYFWLRNGVQLPGAGLSLNVTTSGMYQARILRPSGCGDTSFPVEVQVLQPTGPLVARAGGDTAVCTSIPHILGGMPSATGGTASLHPLRGIGANGASNELVRFDPQNPTEFFKTVKTGFNPDGNTFYSGAAITPNGLFMMSRNDKFVKVDTATGQVTTIGVPVPQDGFWQGMTYNPVQQKIYAVASNNSSNLLYEINERTGLATLLGTISGANNMTLVWIAADTNGDMFAMRIASSGSAQIFRINLNPLTATALPNGTGFQSNYAQDAEFDALTGKLILFAVSRPIGSGRDYPGLGLWEGNKTTGTTSMIGSLARPFNWFDALAFTGSEYRYSWSPATYLSNPNDPNPIFSGAPPGNYTYTLTVTDLCGQTAQSSLTITVKPPVSPNASGVLFVKADATGNKSGNSWANAITNLQYAIQNSCHDVKQIWVANGTYKPTAGNNRDSAFTLKNNLAIYGGFAGTETTLAQRNMRLNATILSGDIGTINNRNDNSYNVLFNDNNLLNATAILDGFIIRDGHANKGEYGRQRGGGMYNFNTSPLIRNCIFTANFALAYGGAVFNQWPTATPTFINCVFSGNQAQWGGAIYNESAQTRVFNSTFSSNEVANTGGAIYSYGQALATVRNSVVWGNTNGITTAPIDNSTPIEVTHSIVEGQGVYIGTGNLNVNPLFVRQAAVGLGQLGDIRLLACSPGINSGSNSSVPAGITTDVRGVGRFTGTAVDRGAYERASTAQAAIIFVDATAKGLNDGSSWTNAYNSLTDALFELNNCGSGPSPTIQIATGTYTIPVGLNHILDKQNAILLGGYPVGGGTRNAATNLVVIKGVLQVLKNATIDGVRVEKAP